MAYQMPIHRVQCRFVVGIDADIDKSGLFACNRQTKQFLFDTLSLFDLLETFRAKFPPAETEVIVEAGWENESFFHLAGFPPGFEKWPQQNRYAYVAKVGSRVGENHGIGKTIVHVLTAMGYNVRTLPPKSGKWSADMFKRQTGLTNGCNEEIRDAARIMWPFI